MIGENKFIDDIAIVILSCDKFSITWIPCIDHLFNAWPNCPYKVYLLNNSIPIEDSRVINLLVGEDHNWSDSLIKGLKKLTESRVLFLYDDAFITFLNAAEVQRIFNTAIQLNLDSVTLMEKPVVLGSIFSKDLMLLHSRMRYRNSLFMNLFKREILLELLRSGESAWQFEKDGNVRSSGLNFYMVCGNKYFSHHHGIIKGRWMPNVKNYLLDKGYDLSLNDFGTYSDFEVMLMKIYRILFIFGHKIIASYNSLFRSIK